MKKGLIYLCVVLVFIASACSKEQTNEESAGNISGMGDATGEIQVSETFTLPEGVTFSSDITGLSPSSVITETSSVELKCTSSGGTYGSYPMDISVEMHLKNESKSEQEVVFPEGCIFKVKNEEGCQNGIILHRTCCKIDGNSEDNFHLNLFCLNHGKNGSDESYIYEIAGVTSSDLISEFIDILEPYSRLGYEYIEEDDHFDEFKNISETIQDNLWQITNGDGLCDNEKNEFENYLSQFDFIH